MPYVDVTCPRCDGNRTVITTTTTNVPETCPDCDGSGHDKDDFSKADPRCRGTGKISVERTVTSEDRCPRCDGHGMISVIQD